jgi:hypothetical protein
MLRSQTSVPALLERAVVKNVSFIMAGICMGQKRTFSAWLESVVVKIVSFSMAAICIVQKRQLLMA